MKVELDQNAQSCLSEGDNLVAQQQYDEAIEQYSQVIQSNPDYVPAIRKIALSYEMSNQLEQAISNYQRLTELKPNNANVYKRLANVLNEQGNSSEAIAAYNKVIELQPDQSERIYLKLGDLLKQNEQLEEAIQAYKKALELNCESRKACLSLGRTYIELGRFYKSKVELMENIDEQEFEPFTTPRN